MREREEGQNDKGAIIGCLKTYLYPGRDKDNLERPCSRETRWREDTEDGWDDFRPRNYRIIDAPAANRNRAGFSCFSAAPFER